MLAATGSPICCLPVIPHQRAPARYAEPNRSLRDSWPGRRAGGPLFMAVAALGLWLSRDYPIGTALRMGTGYSAAAVVLVLLGSARLCCAGLRTAPALRPGAGLAAVVSVAARCVFGLSLERLGLVVSICCYRLGALATRTAARAWSPRWCLIALSWGIFHLGLGADHPVWPEW
jgi:hypothetical protein